MVSLCPTSYEKAQKIDNFSKWVREKLLEESHNAPKPKRYHALCQDCGTQWASHNRSRIPNNCGKCLHKGILPTMEHWVEDATPFPHEVEE